MGNDHEVKLHEIEIGGQVIWRSWDQQNFGFFMISKFKKALLGNFDLMIDLLVTKNNHEIKIQKALLGISTPWLFC